jgi:hypothetical protein
MNLREAFICWTPKGELHDPHNERRHKDNRVPDLRGQVDVHPQGTHAGNMRGHAHTAGLVDTRAHDPDPRVRNAYAQEVARLMIDRDGLDAKHVHQFLYRNIDEYRDSCPEGA